MIKLKYYVSVVHPEWDMDMVSKTDGYLAKKFAADLRNTGTVALDKLNPEELEACTIQIYHEKRGVVYNRPFTKRYINEVRERQKESVL